MSWSIKDNHQRKGGKADPFPNEGRQQLTVRQGECRNTTGVREQGMRLAGNTGTWESQLSPCARTGTRSAGKKEAWRWAEASLPHSEPSETGHTKEGGVSKVSPREVTNGACEKDNWQS